MPPDVARATLRAEIVTGRVPDDVVRRWRELALAAENPFALPEWHAAWVAAHPADAPCVLVCREGMGDVVGVLGLVLRGRRLLAAGDELVDWSGPACAPGDEARVAAAVVQALAWTERRWDVWEIDRCTSDGAWIVALRDVAADSPIKLLARRDDGVLVAIDLERDGPHLRTGKNRREQERLSRRLREGHEVLLRVAGTSQQAEDDLRALLRMRAARWGESFDAQAEVFLRDLVESLAGLGLLRMWAIDIDGSPAGVLLGWRIGSRAFAYSHAFDAAYARYGIGIALLAHAVRASDDEGCTRFDMLRGDERFKASFHIAGRATTSVSAVRRRSLARVEAQALVAARSAYRRLPPHKRQRLRSSLRRWPARATDQPVG